MSRLSTSSGAELEQAQQPLPRSSDRIAIEAVVRFFNFTALTLSALAMHGKRPAGPHFGCSIHALGRSKLVTDSLFTQARCAGHTQHLGTYHSMLGGRMNISEMFLQRTMPLQCSTPSGVIQFIYGSRTHHCCLRSRQSQMTPIRN